MLTITQNQALQRWDTLPDTLREALYSEANSDFLWKTCENENVPGEKTYDVARIAGYVLLGFMHPADMAEELKEELNLDPKTCAAVANAIDGRIFGPLRPDIDKIYQPLSKFESGPKIIQDISSVHIADVPVPSVVSPVPTPSAPSTTAVSVSASAPAPKPNLSGVGWSRSTPEAPVVKLSQTSTPPPMPAPAEKPVVPVAFQKPPAIPMGGPIGEFERRAIPPVAVAPAQSMPSSSKTPAPAAGPAPMIIHEDATFKSQHASPDFHLPLHEEKIDMQKSGAGPAVRPAVLELGNAPAQTAKQSASVSTPRMVHYTDYKSPSPEAPIVPAVPTGPRQITEITAPPAAAVVPRPPVVPHAPVMPKPPAPVVPSTKVIYKDYSEPASPPAPPLPPMPPVKK